VVLGVVWNVVTLSGPDGASNRSRNFTLTKGDCA